MLKQANSSRSSPASRGQVKQVLSWLFFPAPGREELSLGSLPLPGYPEEQITSSAGDMGTGRTALLSRLDGRAIESPVCRLISPGFFFTLIKNVFPRSRKI